MTDRATTLAAIELLLLAADLVASGDVEPDGMARFESANRLGVVWQDAVYRAARDAEKPIRPGCDAPSRVASLLAAAAKLRAEVTP